MITFLIVIIVVLFGLLVYSGVRIENLMHRHENDIDHAKCMAHVAHYVGNTFAAHVLRAAAEDYATPAEQHQLEVIIQQQWSTQGGVPNDPVPAIWMKERADALLTEVGA